MTPELKTEIQAAAEKYMAEHRDGWKLGSSIMADFALTQVFAQIERDAEIAADWASHYPIDIFIEPPSGEHGESVDACSARAMRHAAKGIAAAIKGQIEQK